MPAAVVTVPASQGGHTLSPAEPPAVPAPQLAHTVNPVEPAYVPATQFAHAPDELAAKLALNAPSPHATQSAEVVELPTVPYVPATH